MTARVGRGVPEGGQFASGSHTDDDILLPAPDVDPVARLRERLLAGEIGAHSAWDNTHLLPAQLVGIRSHPDTSGDAFAALDAWRAAGSPQPPILSVPIEDIAGVQQGELRADALAWYLDPDRDPATHWDDQPSFYGFAGPVLYRRRDGSLIVLDGCHRYAAALLRGEATLRVQIIDVPDEPAATPAPAVDSDQLPLTRAQQMHLDLIARGGTTPPPAVLRALSPLIRRGLVRVDDGVATLTDQGRAAVDTSDTAA